MYCYYAFSFCLAFIYVSSLLLFIKQLYIYSWDVLKGCLVLMFYFLCIQLVSYAYFFIEPLRSSSILEANGNCISFVFAVRSFSMVEFW